MLKLIVKPRIRNVNNISFEQLASELASEPEQVESLKKMERLSKKNDLIVKVYRAMNNWVRAKLENNLPSNENFAQMIE